jgi:hypothetical protein
LNTILLSSNLRAGQAHTCRTARESNRQPT